MNDHTPATDKPQLRTLDLGTLGIEDAAGQLLACDIDDPDCELPEVVKATPSAETGEAGREP